MCHGSFIQLTLCNRFKLLTKPSPILPSVENMTVQLPILEALAVLPSLEMRIINTINTITTRTAMDMENSSLMMKLTIISSFVAHLVDSTDLDFPAVVIHSHLPHLLQLARNGNRLSASCAELPKLMRNSKPQKEALEMKKKNSVVRRKRRRKSCVRSWLKRPSRRRKVTRRSHKRSVGQS